MEYLDENIIWIWKEENLSSRRFSTIQILGDKVNLFYYGENCDIPKNITTIGEYKKYSTSKIREKVFAKWINKEISNNELYVKTKKACSEMAGKRVSELIQQNFSTERMYFSKLWRNNITMLRQQLQKQLF